MWYVSYLHHFSEIIIIEWSICDIIQSFRNLIGTGLWGVWLGSDSLVGNYTPHSSKTARISFVCGIHSIVHLVLTFFTCLIFFCNLWEISNICCSTMTSKSGANFQNYYYHCQAQFHGSTLILHKTEFRHSTYKTNTTWLLQYVNGIQLSGARVK